MAIVHLHLAVAKTLVGEHDNDAGSFKFRHVLQWTKLLQIQIRKCSVARLARTADDIVIASDGQEWRAQLFSDRFVDHGFLLPLGGIAGVALNHVANGEDGVGLNAIQVAHRGLQIWQSPIAAGGAVRKNGDAKWTIGHGHWNNLLIYIWFALANKWRRSGGRVGNAHSDCEQGECIGACHADGVQ